jgi:ABC-2 type transport system permease protein
MIDGRTAALIGRLWRQHRIALLTMAVGLALFELVVAQVAPTPGEMGFLGNLFALLPPQIAAFAGGEMALASPRGVIAFGYLHPFFLALFSAWTIRVAAGALAGEIGRGTMDLLAARPVPRSAHVLAAWVMIAAGLALLGAAAWTGTAIGLATRSLGVTPREILVLPAMAWLLFVAWGSAALFVSAVRRDAGSAIAWTSGVVATAFVLDFLARVWSPIAWMRPLSLFAYYRPSDIVRDGVSLADPARLAVVAIAATALAVLVFKRRDL